MMRVPVPRWLLVPVLSLMLCGCRGSTSQAPSAPPGGPAAPPPGAPPGSVPIGGQNPSAGGAASDAAMTAKVRNALITGKVDVRTVRVNTNNGVVTLTGSVPTAAQKSLAEKAAKQVSGVTTVRNQLSVGGKK